MRKAIIVGAEGSGKTTLATMLEPVDVPAVASSSQELCYRSKSIEIPGHYLENRYMTKFIVVMVQNQGSELMLLQDIRNLQPMYSDGFGYLFNIRVTGILTYLESILDKNDRDDYLRAGISLLERAGASQVYGLSCQADKPQLLTLKKQGSFADTYKGGVS